jgi:hypothetical protein
MISLDWSILMEGYLYLVKILPESCFIFMAEYYVSMLKGTGCFLHMFPGASVEFFY